VEAIGLESGEMRIQRKLVMLVGLVACFPALVWAGGTATLRNGFTIHYDRREINGEVTRLYLAESAECFVDVPTEEIIEVEADKTPSAVPEPVKPQPTNRPIRIEEALSAASQKNNISPDLLRSVIRAESGFNPGARSPKGAQGLMQLMPATAARMGVRDAFDPVQNVDGGARYLRELLGRYDNNLTFALAAYNAGPERVERFHGVPPYRETISYVSRVLQNLSEAQTGKSSGTNWNRSTSRSRKSSAPNLDAVREFQSAIAADGQEREVPSENGSDAVESN